MASKLNGKGEKLAKAALSVSRTKVTITGDYEADRQKFGALIQDFAIAFDANNNVLENGIKDDVESNKNRLDIIESKLDSIASFFGITYYPNYTIHNENYTTHTHDYEDGTINDTNDGTGTQTDTTRTTTGVS